MREEGGRRNEKGWKGEREGRRRRVGMEGELIFLLPLPLVPHYLICVFHIGTAPRSAS